MATVYQTAVSVAADDYYRNTGETVAVDGVTYVRPRHGTYMVPMDEHWHPTQAAADECAAIELEKRIGQIREKVNELRRPLPAAAAADHSAAGRAHAGVAT
jgi:hypothetical protein